MRIVQDASDACRRHGIAFVGANRHGPWQGITSVRPQGDERIDPGPPRVRLSSGLASRTTRIRRNARAWICDDIKCSLTSRSWPVRGRAPRPRPERGRTAANGRRTPGFGRRRGLGSLGAGDWLRSARGIGFVRRGRIGFVWREGLASVGAGDWLRSAPGIGFVPRRGIGFVRRRNWLRSAPQPVAPISDLGAQTETQPPFGPACRGARGWITLRPRPQPGAEASDRVRGSSKEPCQASRPTLRTGRRAPPDDRPEEAGAD